MAGLMKEGLTDQRVADSAHINQTDRLDIGFQYQLNSDKPENLRRFWCEALTYLGDKYASLFTASPGILADIMARQATLNDIKETIGFQASDQPESAIQDPAKIHEIPLETALKIIKELTDWWYMSEKPHEKHYLMNLVRLVNNPFNLPIGELERPAKPTLTTQTSAK